MSRPALAHWQALPRMPRALMELRNAVAPWLHLHADHVHARHDLRCRLALEPALQAYPLWITVHGAMGTIGLGLDAGGVLPALSAGVMQAIPAADARCQALEWVLMPWLDELEALLGCEVRIAALELDARPPVEEVLAMSVRTDDGRRAHIAMSGGGLAQLAAAFPRCRTPPPAWGRVPLSALLRVAGLTLAELRGLVPGAWLRLRPYTLQLQTGGIRMAAHWVDDEGARIEERIQTDAGLGSVTAGEGAGPLVPVAQLGFDVDVVLATQRLSVQQLGGLCPGAVLALAPPCDGQRVTLVHQGATIARGELARVEDELVVVITDAACPPAG